MKIFSNSYSMNILGRSFNSEGAFFYIGFLYKKYERHIPLNIYISLASIAILIGVVLFKRSIKFGNPYNISFVTMSFAVSLLGIYFNVYLSKIISLKGCRWLEFIGTQTFVIMALHFLSFKLIGLLQIYLYSYPIEMLAKFPVLNGGMGWWIIYSVVGVFIPITIKCMVVRLFEARTFLISNKQEIKDGSPCY